MSGLRSNFTDQFLADALPVLDALVLDEYKKYPDMVDAIFNVKPSSSWGEQSSGLTGIKPAVVKAEGAPVAFDDVIQGYDKTYQHICYSIATSFSEELIEDDRLGMVESAYRSLGLAMYQTKQVTGFAIFNDGFGDVGPDGSSLFATNHTLADGSNYANSPTAAIALSVAGLRSMEVSMMRQVNHRSINVMMIPRCILVPPELSQDAKELIKSPDKPSTSNRAINSFYDMSYDPIVSPFLTDSNNWFAIADGSQHQLRYYNRVAPSTYTWVDDPTGSVNTKIRSRFSVGYSDFMGTWGTNP